MRINFDLFRNILIDIANHDGSYDLGNSNLFYEGIDNNTIAYHLHMLVDAGYIKAIDVSDKINHYNYAAIELTFSGQSFLYKIESDNLWEKIKSYLGNGAIELSFKAIEIAATKFL